MQIKLQMAWRCLGSKCFLVWYQDRPKFDQLQQTQFARLLENYYRNTYPLIQSGNFNGFGSVFRKKILEQLRLYLLYVLLTSNVLYGGTKLWKEHGNANRLSRAEINHNHNRNLGRVQKEIIWKQYYFWRISHQCLNLHPCPHRAHSHQKSQFH